jgi:hypothetical protein
MRNRKNKAHCIHMHLKRSNTPLFRQRLIFCETCACFDAKLFIPVHLHACVYLRMPHMQAMRSKTCTHTTHTHTHTFQCMFTCVRIHTYLLSKTYIKHVVIQIYSKHKRVCKYIYAYIPEKVQIIFICSQDFEATMQP